jgi:DNA-binding PadR family transcriptional regulator
LQEPSVRVILLRQMMYELFILSKLMHRPIHAYLLREILNFAIGPFRRVSWGTLYPLMRRLEKAGYIIASNEDRDDPRGKRQYRTTQAGRDRFFELMRKPADHDADTRDSFRLKLGCFGHLKEADRRRILKDYRVCLERTLQHTAAMVERLGQHADLASSESSFALLGLEHQRKLAQFEIAWIDSQIEHAVGKVQPPDSKRGHPDPKNPIPPKRRAKT